MSLISPCPKCGRLATDGYCICGVNPFERDPVRVATYMQDIHSEPVCTVSKSDYDKLKSENDQLWRDVDRLRAQLAACAAGAWRTDVENAPIGVWLLCQFKYRLDVAKKLSELAWETSTGKLLSDPIAFAVPNAPQKTGD